MRVLTVAIYFCYNYIRMADWIEGKRCVVEESAGRGFPY